MRIRLKMDDHYTTEGVVVGNFIKFPSFECQILEGESPLDALIRVFGKCEVEVF